MTIPHLVQFDPQDAPTRGRLDAEAWDALRLGGSRHYALAADRAAWERMADERPEIGERMRRLSDVLRAEGAASLASYGVGAAVPECWLLRVAPGIALTMTDYGPATVAALRELVGDAARVERHDLLADPPLAADVHLFHRLDTEFRDRQWRGVMRRFRDQTVILVATEVLDADRVRHELRAMPHRRHWTRAGWIRTRGAFERLWRRTHRAEPLSLGDLEAWLLRPRG